MSKSKTIKFSCDHEEILVKMALDAELIRLRAQILYCQEIDYPFDSWQEDYNTLEAFTKKWFYLNEETIESEARKKLKLERSASYRITDID